jgi:hypothetical protein
VSVERFIYYRAAALPAVRDAVLAMQRALCARHPQLQARLLCRRDAGAEATWMETYAAPALATGVDDALLAEIESQAAPALAAHLTGARHIESFQPCAW